MDGPTIQAKVYGGYAKAANVIGVAYDLYRPSGPSAPMAPGNKVSTLKAALDSTSSYAFRQPNEYGDPTWYALINDATTQAGDYLTNATGTYFIAGKQFLLPVILVECTRSLRVVRQLQQTAVGEVGYGGTLAANEVPVLGDQSVPTYWPASILISGSGGKTLGLPSSAHPGHWRILLPPSVPAKIMAGDIATDDQGRRFLFLSTELTDLGWRITASEVHA